jgi:hypothetical protein
MPPRKPTWAIVMLLLSQSRLISRTPRPSFRVKKDMWTCLAPSWLPSPQCGSLAFNLASGPVAQRCGHGWSLSPPIVLGSHIVLVITEVEVSPGEMLLVVLEMPPSRFLRLALPSRLFPPHPRILTISTHLSYTRIDRDKCMLKTESTPLPSTFYCLPSSRRISEGGCGTDASVVGEVNVLRC